MRARLEAIVERLFPGMGFRPLYLTAAAAWLMVLYHHHGGGSDAPDWFLDGSAQLFGVDDVQFNHHIWSHFTAVVLLMITPLVLCFVMERWTPRDLGFRIKGTGVEILVVLGLWLFMIPLVWLVHDWGNFPRVYPRLEATRNDMQLFFLFEGLYLVKWIAWEFFFRGFMLFGFGKDFLRRSVLISTIPFTLMHYGKPELEMASAMIAGPILCFLALRGRSIWPGVLLHWLVAGTMNFMACEWWR
ncbi:MAG: CPBP family glutamic-type intramembrane protease [Sandaracinaceae bacterium]